MTQKSGVFAQLALASLVVSGAFAGCHCGKGSSIEEIPDSGCIDDSCPCDNAEQCPPCFVCNQGFCQPAGLGIPGIYHWDAGPQPAVADAGLGAQWPTFLANGQRNAVVSTPNARLTDPVPVMSFPLGQALTRNTGLVATFFGDGWDTAAIEGGRVVFRKANGTKQSSTSYLPVSELIGAADLDGSGKTVVVAALPEPATVYVLDPSDGAVIFSIAAPVLESGGFTLLPNLSGGGLPELALWSNNTVERANGQAVSQTLAVYSFTAGDANGTPLWTWDNSSAPPIGFVTTPLLGDLLGSGTPQLLTLPPWNSAPSFATDSSTGAIAAELATGANGCVGEAVYVRDLDGTGKAQLISLTDHQGIWCNFVGVFDAVPAGSVVDGGTVTCSAPSCIVPRWSLYENLPQTQINLSAPWEDALADLDGTGHPELVYGVFDTTVGSWQMLVLDASTGATLASLPNVIPLDVVPLAAGGATILTLPAPSADLSLTGTVTAYSFSRSKGLLSLLWSSTEPGGLTGVYRTWRPRPTADIYAQGSATEPGGPGLVTLPFSATQTGVLFYESLASASMGQPDTLALLDAQTGTTLASLPLASGDQVSGFEQQGELLWLSSRERGIEELGLDGGALVENALVPGAGYLAPAPLVKANHGVPEIYVQDAVGRERGLAPVDGGGGLAPVVTLPAGQFLALADDGSGGTQWLLRQGNAVTLAQETGATTLWTTPLPNPGNGIEWVDQGRFGPAPGTPGFLLQSFNAGDVSQSTMWAIAQQTGTQLWLTTGLDPLTGRGGVVADLNGDGVDDEANCSGDNDCLIFDGVDGHLLVDLGTLVTSLGVPTGLVVNSPQDGGPTRLYVGSDPSEGGFTTAFSYDRGAAQLLWQAAASEDGQPALVDVNGDGVPDAIYWNNVDNLVARDGLTGAILWQEGLSDGAAAAVSFNSGIAKQGPTVANLSGDGSQQLLFTTGDGWLYAFDLQGDVLYAVNFGGALSPPVVADITGAGSYAVLVTSDDGNLYVLQPPPACQ